MYVVLFIRRACFVRRVWFIRSVRDYFLTATLPTLMCHKNEKAMEIVKCFETYDVTKDNLLKSVTCCESLVQNK